MINLFIHEIEEDKNMNIENRINLIKEYIKHFNKKPNIIGMFWNDPKQLEDNLTKAIETNTPCDEYELLTDEEKIAFDKGLLLF